MGDDLTLGELARNVERLDKAQRQLATDSVPAKLYETAHQALQKTLADHISQSGVDRDRIERAVADLRKAHERDVKALREDLDKEVEQARAENRAQIAALKAEREKRYEFTWTKAIGLLTAAAALAGVIVAALAASKGIH